MRHNLKSCGGGAIFAALVLTSPVLDAGTVAWYHFDEVAPGTPVTSDVRFLNAVDSTKLQGIPYSVGEPGTTRYTTLGSIAEFMPTATNGVFDTVCVADPVGGTTNRNERSLFFTYADDDANNRPARYGGCVQVQSDSSLSLTDMTVEFFVRPVRLTARTNNGWQLVAKQQTNTSKFTYSICVEANGKPYVNVYDSSGTLMNTTGANKLAGSDSILDGLWHHIAFTASGTDAKLYVDGRLASTATLTESLYYVDDKPLYIGASQMSYYMPGGFIDEVRISDEALSPSQFLSYVNPETLFRACFDGTADAETSYGTLIGTTGIFVTASGELPSYATAEIPGSPISDGDGDATCRQNTSSLRFVKSCVKYPHVAELEVPEMTVEFFMKHEAADGYAALLRFNQSTNNWGTTPVWNIGYNIDGTELIMRIDTTEKSNQSRLFGSSFLDGKWHHVAVTFQQGETQLDVKFYDNHRRVGTDWKINGRLNYAKGSCLGVGTSSMQSGFTGWIDEVRISRGVLPVEEFMRVGKRRLTIIIR